MIADIFRTALEWIAVHPGWVLAGLATEAFVGGAGVAFAVYRKRKQDN